MKKTVGLLSLVASISLLSPVSEAQDLRVFLKNCAWGTATGAGLGVVSLAFTDKPSEQWNNVARGASLGLYAGIVYGLYNMNRSPSVYEAPDFTVLPEFQNGKVSGLHVSKVLLDF